DDNYTYSAKFSVSDGTVTLANRDTWETTMKNDPAEGAGAILSEPVNSEEEMSERRITRADENREAAGVSLSEFEAQQAKAAALQAQVDQLLADKRNTTSNEFVTKLKSLGFTEDKGCTAFLKKARSIILSDEGKSVLMLSEDEGSTPKPYTATELITDLFASLPEDK